VQTRTSADVITNISPPVCASTCADFATSEEIIVMTEAFCGGNTSQLTDSRINLIRADFTVCALPANSLRYVYFYALANLVLNASGVSKTNLKTAVSVQIYLNYARTVAELHQMQHHSVVYLQTSQDVHPLISPQLELFPQFSPQQPQSHRRLQTEHRQARLFPQ
jgi:hypothetical protein